MSIELAELHKIYASNKYSPNVFFLNPFTEILFTPNWVWPQDYIAQKKHTVKKPYSNSDNLKQKIKEWFQSIDFETRRNCLTISDKKFIETVCYFLPSYNSDNLYNMKSRKRMRNIEVSEKNSYVEKGLRTILQNLQIAFLKQPILHMSKKSQKFLSNQLIKWMEIISHKKIFQFANKIKQSQIPEDNILWFSEHSYHPLESFFVNEFEKSIIRQYFNRDRIQSNYLMDLKQFCAIEKDSLKGKNVEYELLGYPLMKAVELTVKEVQQKCREMKVIENLYQKEKQKMIQKLIEEQVQGVNKEQGKKRRRRVRRKNKGEDKQTMINDQNEPQKSTSDKLSQHKTNKKSLPVQPSLTVQNSPTPQRLTTSPTSPHNEEQKISMAFNNDEISVISKCEDSEYHQTDVTFEKYFENDERNTMIDERDCMIKGDLNKDKSCELITSPINDDKITSGDYTTLNMEPQRTIVQKQQIVQIVEETPKQKLKKKTKKQKLLQNLHQNLMKSIRNNAFTEFIDTISIESNNLYSYKLSAYQFIVFFVSSLLPTTNITLFGSNAVGLSLASSDIDIMISNTRWASLTQVREVLYHIGNEISKMGWVVDYRLILNAKVPVLKLFIDPKIDYFGHSPLKYTAQTNLLESIVIKADIIVNIEGDANIGCESTLLMKQWLDDHPQLQRIILFFKYILWYYGLNENYRGGICSYCLFLMVVHCLFKKIVGSECSLGENKGNMNNVNGKTILSNMLHDQNEGTYIIEILKYYSETFDPKNDEISITKHLKPLSSSSIEVKQKFVLQSQTSISIPPSKRNLNLKIVDPINGQFIESSFSKFQQIQQLFSMLLVESMKLDNTIKSFLSNNVEFNDQFHKLYLSLSQNQGYNVITKNGEQMNDNKVKKVIKKVQGKIKKYHELKYSVKDIVSIGFKIGIDNWMSSPNNNLYEEKYYL